MGDLYSRNDESCELVSIIIPVFNAEKYVIESIISCIEQTYYNIEIIVVNDGSTDNSAEEILKCVNSYSNVRFIDLCHMGKINAINKGVENATGKYIAIHAADDVCFPYRIEKEIELIKSNDKIGLVFGDMEIVDDKLNTISHSFWSREGIKIQETNSFRRLLSGNFVSGGTILFKSELKEVIFPIPETLSFEDWWIALIASYYSEIKSTSNKLIKYRQHSNNENARYNEMDIRKLVDNRKRLLNRNYNYYEEFEKFILKRVHDNEDKKKYLNIINYSRLMDRLAVTPGFFSRILQLISKLNKYIIYFGFRNIYKLFTYVIFGEKLLYFKYKRKSLIKSFSIKLYKNKTINI